MSSDALVETVKQVHRCYPTGVTIVTTCVDGDPYGLAVNAFSSISLAPPLVLVCVNERTSTHARLFLQDEVAVNILASDQAELARRFGSPEPDKFAGVPWRRGESGAPLLDGVAAHLELAVEARVRAYTHTIFIGRVVAAASTDRVPLLYLASRFFHGDGLRDAA